MPERNGPDDERANARATERAHAGEAERAGPREADRAKERGTPPDPSRRELTAWAWRIPVLAALGFGSWGLYEGIRTHFFKEDPDPDPTFEPGPTVPVAPLASFDRDWAEAEFAYRYAPAIALRLPGPVPGGLTVAGADGEELHLAAFSRVCTHQGCLVTLNRDVEAVAFAFNHRADGPSLTCGCHLSVFSPDRAGRAVAGPAVRPLPRVRLERDGDALIATGIEGAEPPDAPYDGERAV